MNNFQCYITSDHKDTLTWDTAYQSDPSTNALFQLVSSSSTRNHPQQQHTTFSKADLLPIEPAYHQPFQDGRIKLLNNKLVLFRTIFKNEKFLCLIIVPKFLCRKIFLHFHAGPSGAHTG